MKYADIESEVWQDLVVREALGHATADERARLESYLALWRGTLVMLTKRLEGQLAGRREEAIATRAAHQATRDTIAEEAHWRRRTTHLLTKLQARAVEVKRLLAEAGHTEHASLLSRVAALEDDVAALKEAVL